jgi:hypothetical protein
MDSRKREGIAECVRSLETDLDELTADVPKDCVHKQDAYLMLDKIDSLLTAEPEPRGDARELLGAMFRTIRELGYREPPLTLRKETSEACVQLIESYASRLAQEARADERAIVEREVAAKLADPVAVYANALRGTIDVSEVRADERRRIEETEKHGMRFIDATPDSGYVLRILQAYIDDSYYSDNTVGLPPENRMVKIMNETREKRNGLLRSAIAILQGTEPAETPITNNAKRDFDGAISEVETALERLERIYGERILYARDGMERIKRYAGGVR